MIIKYSLYISALVLVFVFGTLSLHLCFKNMAYFRSILYMIGENKNVKAQITPVWSMPSEIGNYKYQSRIYAVSLSIN